MNVSIIQLICNIVMFVCCLFVSFCNKQLRNRMINQQEKKIKTLHIRCNKSFPFLREDGKPSLDFAGAKQYMADCIAKQIIKDNILQIKDFDTYYEGSVDFVKSETNFQGE